MTWVHIVTSMSSTVCFLSPEKNTIFTDIDLFNWNHGAIKGLQNNCDSKLIFFYVNTNLFVNIRMMGVFLGFQEIRKLIKEFGIFNFPAW